MKILVTGYKGFIGQNMVNALTKEYDVVGYEWGEKFPSLYDIDYVIHLGAISSTTYKDVTQLLKQNYFFTVDLLEQCNTYLIPVQFASSASVYGVNNRTFNEEDLVDPRNLYSWSKVMVEEFVKCSKWNIPIQIFRYFNVYGPHEEHKGSQASPFCQFRQQALKTGKIKLFENSGSYFRDFVHVDQVIDVHKKLLGVNRSGIWNLGTGKSRSFQSVANEIAKEFNAEIEYVKMPEELKHSYQEFTEANLTKLNSLLNSL